MKPYKTYPGGKSGSGVYQSIINHIPPHTVLVVPFAGNCGVFNHIRRADWTVLNDIDKDVMNTWYETGISIPGDVRLFNIDALTFLRCDIRDREYSRLYNQMFIYLDPPYLKSVRKSKNDLYNHEFGTDQQHIELLNEIKQLPEGIKVMISSYPNDLYNKELQDWHFFDFKAKTRKSVVIERIYMNYNIEDSLHDYKYIGQNFRQRERYSRIVNNFFLKLDRMEPILRNKIISEYSHRIK